MRINNEEHLKCKWRVHSLLPDFTIEDTWLLPIDLKADECISQVQLVLTQALQQTAITGVAGFLFKFRMFLGRLFGWEDHVPSVTALQAGSIRARYAEQESLHASDFTTTGFGGFIPVYELDIEVLLEIENKTVLAACHLGKIALGSTNYGVHMTVYVKPKGQFGKFYMQLIKPFRLYIVYPALLKMIGKQWEKHKH